MRSFLVAVVDVFLALHLRQQIVAFLEHLRVFADAVGRRVVIIVHLIVVDVVAVSVRRRIGISTKKFENIVKKVEILRAKLIKKA